MGADFSDLMLVPLNRDSPVPVLRQLYLELRRSILAGAIPPGGRLPPTRTLAVRLGVARNTVVAAYEQLLAEGFIEGRVGARSFVSHDLPDEAASPPPVANAQPPPAPPAPPPPAPPAIRRFAGAGAHRSVRVRPLQYRPLRAGRTHPAG